MYFNFNFLKPLKLREIQVLKFGLYIYIYIMIITSKHGVVPSGTSTLEKYEYLKLSMGVCIFMDTLQDKINELL